MESSVLSPFDRPERDRETFVDALGFLIEEHARQRLFCDILESSVRDGAQGLERLDIEAVLTFLKNDFVDHFKDEEWDLFPALRRRAATGDQMDAVLDQLMEEHALDEEVIAFVVEDLERLADARGAPGSSPPAVNLTTFAISHRRHIAWENAVLMPWARRLLTPADLIAIGRAMAARRGITFDAEVEG